MSISSPASNHRQKLYTSLWAIALLAVALFILPLTVYFYNASEFKQPLIQYLTQQAWIALIVLPVFALLCLNSKTSKFIRAFSIIGIVYLLATNFLLPVNFGSLDGATVSKVSVWKDLSILHCAALLLAVVAFFFFVPKMLKDLAQIGIIGAFAYSAYSLATQVSAENLHGHDKPMSEQAQEQLQSLQTFSTTKNILVISLDGIQENMLDRVLRANPELANEFTGFNYFRDTLAPGPSTKWSVLSTMLGRIPPLGKKGIFDKEYAEAHTDQAITMVAGKHDFQVSTLTHLGMFAPEASGRLDIQTLISTELDPQATALQPIEVAILRVVPASISWRILERLQAHKSTASMNEETQKILADTGGYQFALGVPVFRKMTDSITLTDKPVMKFYHFLFSHAPATRDAQCNYVSSTENKQEPQAYENFIACTYKEVANFLKQLKAQGLYDQSLIILTSDHGYPAFAQDFTHYDLADRFLGEAISQTNPATWTAARYMPTLLIKPMNADNTAMKQDNYPASLLDIAPTICASALPTAACSKLTHEGTNLLANKRPTRSARDIIIFTGDVKNVTDVQNTNIQSHDLARFSVENNAHAHLPRQLTKGRWFKCGEIFALKDQNRDNVRLWPNAVTNTAHGLQLPANKATLAFYSEKNTCPKKELHLAIRNVGVPGDAARFVEITLNGKKLIQIPLAEISKEQPTELTLHLPSEALEPVLHNILQIKPVDSTPELPDLSVEIHSIGIM